MKLVVFVALLAFAAARNVRNSPVVVSTPDKVVVVSTTENEKPSELLEKNTYEPYRYEQYEQKYLPSYGQKLPNIYEKQYLPYQEQQYRPQGNPFEVPQYIAYELQQAHQLGYTVGQVQSYYLRQGFPEFIAQYFVEQYQAYLSQPWGKSPYLTFQYYYKQVVPQEVREWIIQRIGQAYQHYYQYLSKDEQYVWQQEYPYPQSVSQYVTEQGKYNSQNSWSYQLLFRQLQQTFEYTQRAMQYLESGNVPQEVYQYLFKQLQQGQQYLLNAEKVYQMYQDYPEYYIPYSASQYFFQQIQEAYQYYENAYQYVQQQQLQGTSQSLYLFEQVRYAYQYIKIAYQIRQQNQIGQTYSGLNYYQGLRQILLNIENVHQYIQRQVNFPQEYILKFTQAYQIYQTLPKLIQEGDLPQQMHSYLLQQIQHANQYLVEVYEFAQQQGLQYIVQQLQYVLQVTKNFHNFYGYQNQYRQDNGQYQPMLQQDRYYEQLYPTINRPDVSQSWVQKYLNKNTYPATYKYQGENQLKTHTQYYPENYPAIMKELHQEDLTKNAYYPTNYVHQEQQWKPYTQYYPENYPINYKYQEQYKSLPYTQKYEQKYPTYKQDYTQYFQKYLNKGSYYPTEHKFEEQYLGYPQTQYYGPYNYSNQYQYGPYSSTYQNQYSRPYYYNQSNKPYQYGHFSQPAVAA